MLLLASVTYPLNTLPLRAINTVLLVASVWNLFVFFTPLAQKLRTAFDFFAILVDVILISWVVRMTGGFQSEFGLLYFVELLLVAFFSERPQLLVSLVFCAVGLCSSLLSFHASSVSPQGSAAILMGFGRWKPEDLSALGVRTVALVAVYLIGYVGQVLKEQRQEQSPHDSTGPGTNDLLPSAERPPVVESVSVDSKPASPVGEHLSIISHELRSPLTILRAYADLLMDPNHPYPTEDIVAKIDEEVSQLSEMISNLDAIVDERAAASAESFKVVNLAAILRSLIDTQKPLSDRHRFILQCPRADIPIMGDKIKLTRAFGNILGNAVKYSPAGGTISVSADVQERRHLPFLSKALDVSAGSQPFAVIKFSDTGMGMSAEAVSSAFEKFRRLDTERTRQIPGTGLGLYLTRRIVEEHQGVINLESVENRGTTVTVAIPLFVKGEMRG